MNHRWMTVGVGFITIDGAEQSAGALEGQANSVDCLSSARPRVNRLPVAGPDAAAGRCRSNSLEKLIWSFASDLLDLGPTQRNPPSSLGRILGGEYPVGSSHQSRAGMREKRHDAGLTNRPHSRPARAAMSTAMHYILIGCATPTRRTYKLQPSLLSGC